MVLLGRTVMNIAQSPKKHIAQFLLYKEKNICTYLGS